MISGEQINIISISVDQNISLVRSILYLPVPLNTSNFLDFVSYLIVWWVMELKIFLLKYPCPKHQILKEMFLYTYFTQHCIYSWSVGCLEKCKFTVIVLCMMPIILTCYFFYTELRKVACYLFYVKIRNMYTSVIICSLYNWKTRYSQQGDPYGHDWVPAECDVSIRPGWFWHTDEVPKSALNLLDLFYKSVGRNCLLLLNVPPNSSGLISDKDIEVLREFTKLRSFIFSHNLAENAKLSVSSTRGGLNDSRFESYNVLKEGIDSYWAPRKDQSSWVLYLDFPELATFNVLLVQEPIQMGQRIMEFHLDILNKKGEWQKVAKGTTVGYRRLLLFPEVETYGIRLVIDKSRADPLISYLGIFRDPFTNTNVHSTDVVPKLDFKYWLLSKIQTKLLRWLQSSV